MTITQANSWRPKILFISSTFVILSFFAFLAPYSGKAQAQKKLGVNAKYFDGDRISTSSSAVFWFGKLDQTANHVDVRIGYNANEIQIFTNIFDSELFYDQAATVSEFDNWDSVDIYLRPQGSNTSYLFKNQFHHFQSSADYRLAYRNSGSGYSLDNSIPFQTAKVWYGQSPNQATNPPGERGWYSKFNIPFSSLGLTTAPSKGTVWDMAIVVHDRDDAAGTTINQQIWPSDANVTNPASWGELRFSRTADNTPFATQTGTLTLRHGINGVTVPDSHVGGGANCGEDHHPNFFNGWSTHNFPGVQQINIQNQMNVEDWPCFSKYFISFPVDQIPAGKIVLSAELTMFHFGNAGGNQSSPSNEQARGSTLQVMTVDSSWDETTLNWQNSPSVVEHIADTWVTPIINENNFASPAIPVTWDIKSAVTQAYAANETLNLAIYAADWDLHSGKYFYSSDARDDYHRPILTITYGDAAAPTDFAYLPIVIR